jgi:hypothetical protein
MPNIRGCVQKLPDWVVTKYTLTTIKTRWEATQRVMAAKLTRLTHKIAIKLHLVTESCTICSSRSRQPVRKLLDNLRSLARARARAHTHTHPPTIQGLGTNLSIAILCMTCLCTRAVSKFVDSPFYTDSEMCGGAVTVSFSKYLPWQAMHFLQRSTHFSKTCCKPFAAGFRRIVEQAVSCLGAPFSRLEKSRNRMGRDLDCMADVPMGLYLSRWVHPMPL